MSVDLFKFRVILHSFLRSRNLCVYLTADALDHTFFRAVDRDPVSITILVADLPDRYFIGGNGFRSLLLENAVEPFSRIPCPERITEFYHVLEVAPENGIFPVLFKGIITDV